MKWDKQYKFLVFSFQILICNSCFAGLAINYSSPSFSGVVIDDYTGNPVEGAIVQVSWVVLRSTGNEHNPDMMNMCLVTTTTDKYGVYKIPAWKSKVDMEWELYGAGWDGYVDNPHCSVSIPKNKTTNRVEQIQFNLNHGGDGPSTFPASQGFVIWAKSLKPPRWAISEAEVQEQENPIPDVPTEVLSNSLTFYIAHHNKVQDGRFIGPPDFEEWQTCYIRPKPDLVITNIKSFSTNFFWHSSLYTNWQSVKVTLFPSDAKKVIELQRRGDVDLSPVCMLDNKPSQSIWRDNSPNSTPTGLLTFHKEQDIHEIVLELQKLVQFK